jgi:hypothetical protein
MNRTATVGAVLAGSIYKGTIDFAKHSSSNLVGFAVFAFFCSNPVGEINTLLA